MIFFCEHHNTPKVIYLKGCKICTESVVSIMVDDYCPPQTGHSVSAHSAIMWKHSVLYVVQIHPQWQCVRMSTMSHGHTSVVRGSSSLFHTVYLRWRMCSGGIIPLGSRHMWCSSIQCQTTQQQCQTSIIDKRIGGKRVKIQQKE